MKYFYCLAIAVLLGYLPVNAKNLIPNGGFENDFNQWTNLVGSGAEASFNIETADVVQGSKAMKVTATTPGAEAYTIQSINADWASEEGKEYTLTFICQIGCGRRYPATGAAGNNLCTAGI